MFLFGCQAYSLHSKRIHQIHCDMIAIENMPNLNKSHSEDMSLLMPLLNEETGKSCIQFGETIGGGDLRPNCVMTLQLNVSS